MPLYYVTGVSGSGKSAVLHELKNRGREAFGTDEDGLAGFYHKISGKKDPRYHTAETRTPDWRRYHEWKVPIETIGQLEKKAGHNAVFLCGVVANDAEFWDKFKRTFCLYAPPEEIKYRVLNRSNNDFGKNPHELADVLKWAAYSKQQYQNLGATIIDATQSVEKVVDEILSYVDEK